MLDFGWRCVLIRYSSDLIELKLKCFLPRITQICTDMLNDGQVKFVTQTYLRQAGLSGVKYMMKEIPNIITGGNFTDSRGTLSFVNDFDLLPVRRFYIIDHPDKSVVRAWQAHKTEQKWFYVLTGSFKIVIVKPEEWSDAFEKTAPLEFILRNGDNRLLHVPGGFANGFQTLEPHSKLIVFSNYAIADAGTDDYRFDKNLWYNWG